MGSSRLPGKTLASISGQPLLGHIIDRVRACTLIDSVMVATTTLEEDSVLAKFAVSKGASVYRGSSHDVLDRYYQAALQAGAACVVRITADDPFKDPDVIACIVSALKAEQAVDYSSNTLDPTYPEGLDAEAFTFFALQRTWREAHLSSEREHVTPYIWSHPELFRITQVRHDRDLSHMRWTLDYPEDLQFTREVYSRLYSGQVFRMGEILTLLEKEPRLSQINTGFVRNAGYKKSIQAEQTT
jgi:spore coat polysaccharide biosynthesis protein SpsF